MLYSDWTETIHSVLCDPDGTHLRTVEEFVRRDEGVPGVSTGLEGRYPYVWNPPAEPNGVITCYRMRSSTTRTVTTYYVIQSSDIPGISGIFSVTVAARTIVLVLDLSHSHGLLIPTLMESQRLYTGTQMDTESSDQHCNLHTELTQTVLVSVISCKIRFNGIMCVYIHVDCTNKAMNHTGKDLMSSCAEKGVTSSEDNCEIGTHIGIAIVVVTAIVVGSFGWV